jgi:hypothetical protein
MAAGISFQHCDCRTDCAPELWRPRVDGSELAIFEDREEATLAGAVETGTSYFWLCGPPYNVLPDGFTRDAKKHDAKIIARDKRGSFDVVLRDKSRIRIGDASEWLGEGLNAEACRNTWAKFLALLSEHTQLEGGRWLMPRPTPAQTGRAFFQTYMPRDMAFQRLSARQRKIIMASEDNSTFGGAQARKEIFRHGRTIPAFYYFDHRRFYRRIALSLSMPEGDIIETLGGEFQPFKPAWYEIEARVPDDWPHAGLVQVGGEWIREPGRIFSGWFAEPEAAMLCAPEARGADLDAASPLASSWRPIIKRTLSFSLSGGADRPGFKKAIEKLSAVETAANNCPGISVACRNILLQGIGSLHSARGIEKEIHEDEFRPADYAGQNVRFSQRPDKPEIVIVKRKGSSVSDAPQVAAHLWSSARARITRAMLSIPFNDIVGVHLDAIYTTRPHSFPSHTSEAAFWLKGAIETSEPSPRTIGELELLSARAASQVHSLTEA